MKKVIFICVLALTLADQDFDTRNCLENPDGRGRCSFNGVFLSFEKWYYDYKSGSCERVMWECNSYSNKNIFDSEEDCINKCGNTPRFDTINCLRAAEPGMCPLSYQRFYFDFRDRSCKSFTYTGCNGNQNRFSSKEECMEICSDAPNYESLCDLPSEPGICISNMARYYFDKNTGRCQTFSYGGCGGNENNFRTEEECNQRCGRNVK